MKLPEYCREFGRDGPGDVRLGRPLDCVGDQAPT
jgi:hypothetical protein